MRVQKHCGVGVELSTQRFLSAFSVLPLVIIKALLTIGDDAATDVVEAPSLLSVVLPTKWVRAVESILKRRAIVVGRTGVRHRDGNESF